MTELPDYYAILQVHTSAERAVIDAAYRRLAAKYPPDVNPSPDTAERMVQINAAYEVLSDPARRSVYDASRREASATFRAGPRVRRRPWTAGSSPEGARRISAGWLPWLLVLLVLVVVVRTFRLGPREMAVVAGVGLLLWLLTTRRVKKG